MTQPTREQIGRLRQQFESNHWEVKHRVDGRQLSQWEYAALMAALTAAAQVGDTKELGKYIQTITPSIEARERERTIERCAQIADDMIIAAPSAEYHNLTCQKVAAAIRALKDKP